MRLPVLPLVLLAAACSSTTPSLPAGRGTEASPIRSTGTHRPLAPPFRLLPTCPPAGDSPSPQGCPP